MNCESMIKLKLVRGVVEMFGKLTIMNLHLRETLSKKDFDTSNSRKYLMHAICKH